MRALLVIAQSLLHPFRQGAPVEPGARLGPELALESILLSGEHARGGELGQELRRVALAPARALEEARLGLPVAPHRRLEFSTASLIPGPAQVGVAPQRPG